MAPNFLPFVVLFTCTILIFCWKHFRKAESAKETPNEESHTGDSKWEYPQIAPDLDFDLEKTPEPQFRAFRYSYKRHVIEVKKLDMDTWVLLDNQFPRYHRAKVARLAERGDKIVKTLPHAREAARELCQDLAEFLSRRYPQVYKVVRSETDREGWYEEGSITQIDFPDLGVSYDLTKEDPMTVAGLIQPTDLNLLIKQPDGQYQLSAVMFGIGGGQRLKDKLGQTLANLHLGGRVPQYTEQLQVPLDRFLSKLKVDSPIVRNTTAISIHDALHWPTYTMGPEDDYDPSLGGPGLDTPSYSTFRRPPPVTDISQLFFRQERQTLRRLPRSGAVVWMVHTYVWPLAGVVQEPGVPGRLAALVRSWGDELARHKGRHMYADVLLPYLDDLHQKQVAQGICEDGELPSNFPF